MSTTAHTTATTDARFAMSSQRLPFTATYRERLEHARAMAAHGWGWEDILHATDIQWREARRIVGLRDDVRR